jgi:hypothetical protein
MNAVRGREIITCREATPLSSLGVWVVVVIWGVQFMAQLADPVFIAAVIGLLTALVTLLKVLQTHGTTQRIEVRMNGRMDELIKKVSHLEQVVAPPVEKPGKNGTVPLP